jgi:hypothetical protein
MPKTQLQKAIEQAVENFASNIVGAVRGATVQELVVLQSGETIKSPGRGPGRRPASKIVAQVEVSTDKVAPEKKKRVVRNYPKCAYPRCRRNRFVRGKGYCGKHWKMWLAGEIESADHYKKKRS